jgi:hypothetical protein
MKHETLPWLVQLSGKRSSDFIQVFEAYRAGALDRLGTLYKNNPTGYLKLL